MADTQGIKAGRAYVELGIGDKMAAGLKTAQARLKAFGDGVTKWGTRLFVAGSAIVAPALAAARSFAEVGNSVAKAAQKTGMTTQALSELGYAASLSGVDMETLEHSIAKMQKALVEGMRGSKQVQEDLAVLGLTIADLKDLTPEQQFTLLGEAISRLDDPTKKAAMAMGIFGRGGAALLPLFDKGAAGLGELREEARRLGLSMSTEDAEAAEHLHNAMTTLLKTIGSLYRQIGRALAPALTELSDKAAYYVTVARDWLGQNSGLIVSIVQVAAGVAGAGVALLGLGKAAQFLSVSFGVLAKIVPMILSPVALVIAAVAGMTTVFLTCTEIGGKALDWLRGKFGTLADDAATTFAGIADALAAGDIPLAAKVLWLGLKLEWTRGTAWLSDLWTETMTGLASTWVDTVAGWKLVWNTFCHALEVGWIETTAFLSELWQTWCVMFQHAWLWVAKSLEQTWNHLKGLLDENFNADTANAAAERQYEQSRDAAWNKYKDALGERENQREQERGQAQAESDKQRQEIVAQANRDQKALRQEHDRRIKDSQDELDKAKQKLADASESARRKREGKEVFGNLPDLDAPGGLNEQEALAARIKQGAELTDRKLASVGTFNPAAAWGFGTSSPAERTARAAEETAKGVKKTNTILSNKKALAFAP